MILIITATKHCREHGHAEGGNEYRPFVGINSIPWMFTEQQSNVVKEVMRKIKFPTCFCANLKNIITKKGDFAGVKTHD